MCVVILQRKRRAELKKRIEYLAKLENVERIKVYNFK